MLLPIIGVAVEYVNVPRTYQSSASLWALQRYFVITPTGLESDLTSPPAQTQAGAISELLQTRVFALAAVKGIDLAPTLGLSPSANPQQLQDALYSNISRNVVVTAPAYNLFVISYTNRDPRIAQQVVQSIITTYGEQSLALSTAEGQNLLAAYQTQLAQAQKGLNHAVNAETDYISAHHLAQNQLASDPQYALLNSQKAQAQSTVQNIQNTIAMIQQSIGTGANVGSLFRVIDAPRIPDQSASRTKNYLLGGGIGLGAALLACIIYLIIIIRTDHGVYDPDDLQNSRAFPVIMQLPNLSHATISLLTTPATPGQALFADGNNIVNGHLTQGEKA